MTATADTDLAFAGPAALAARVRAGEVTPRELVELSLRRIETLDPRLNAFRIVRAEQALAEADSLDGSRRDGPLAGVPFAVKDDIALGGEVASKGTRSITTPAAQDGEVVRRLRAAGGIPIGVTNVPELMIFPWTATTANGVTRNPWDPERTPGGSSGGSASAVAAGLVPAATASDGGGSIRIPAACCGLVGMKPSRGAAAEAIGGGGWLGLTVFGALARTVSDSALLGDVIYATDGGRLWQDAAGREPGRLRIAMSRKIPPGLLGKVSADQRDAWERVGARLGSLGHDVVQRDPSYGFAQLEFLAHWLRGVYEESLEVPDRESTLDASTRQMAAGGRRFVPERRRDRMIARRPQTIERVTRIFNDVDVLVTPTMARTAIGAEGAYGKPAAVAINTAGRFTPFTAIFNITGQPAVSIPAGIGSDGLPLSVQLVGRAGAEATLYSLAAQLEAAEPWAERRPVVS